MGEPEELVLELTRLESFTLVPIARLHCTRVHPWLNPVLLLTCPDRVASYILTDYEMVTIVRVLWLVAEWARFSCNNRALWKLFSARQLFWVVSKSYERVGKNNKKMWTKHSYIYILYTCMHVYINNSLHLVAKICWDICPQTLSVRRSDQFFESTAQGKLWTTRNR